MSTQHVGAPIRRVEDPVLVTGEGRFVDDMEPAGVLHASFVRCPLAHARVLRVDAEMARSLPGVYAILTPEDLTGLIATERLPLLVPNPSICHAITQEPLVASEVRYVGEPIAMVIADDRYLAEDAAEQVVVDYEELPPVSDLLSAVTDDAATAHSDRPDNLAALIEVGYGEVDDAFDGASHVVSATFDVHRGTAHPMECRAVLADPGEVGGQTTLYSATQAPHLVKRSVVEVLGIDEDDIRVVAPHDVGGGFGPKVIAYPEEVVVTAAARKFGRAIKWAEDRREHFTTTTHERDQHWDVELAVDHDGTLRGLRGTMLHDTGAYLPWGIISPYISSTTVPGPYVLPSFALTTKVVFTNTTPTSPVRGAGRPQAVFVMERLLDQAADELGMDRAEIRRRNLITEDQMPYAVGLTFRDGSPVIYDSGDYPATLEAALEAADYDSFETRRASAHEEGRYRGIGVACYVEGTGLGPFEGATVRIHKTGEVVIYTGASPQGQGHRTTMAQVCADQLGIDPSDVTVVTGDTDRFPHGIGTFASRIGVNAGNSVMMAAGQVRQQILEIASDLLEVDASDLELADGAVNVAGDPGTGYSLAELARVAGGMPGFALKVGTQPGLDATAYFLTEQATYAHGAHVAEVEVDPATGATQIVRYIVAHDCGNVINPIIVEGQIQGGLAHGVGNALLERMHYDENAQPLTTTFGDYLLPLATDVPKAEIVHLESPTPLNPLGVKGAGEGGTIPAAAAIVSAIEDALKALDVQRIRTHPVTGYQVLRHLGRFDDEAEPLDG